MDLSVKRSLRGLCGVVVLALAATVGASAQAYNAEKPLGSAAQDKPSYLAHAGIDQKLGVPLPLESVWTDATGKTGPLKGWFDGKPVVMAEMYYQCKLLCPQVMSGLAASLKGQALKPGKDYDVVVFSIDPMDKPQDALGEKQEFLHDAGWGDDASGAVHFLTGSQASIDAVSAASGFNFVRVPGPDGKMDQFAHSSVIMFATPDGRMSRYLSGIDYPARDVRMAILDASEKKISNPVDLIILYCCNYSPAAGKYTVSIVRVLGIAGMASLLIVIGMIVLLTRKPKQRAA